MTAFRLAAFELARFRTPLQRIALVFAVCVPLLYGALYLWSNWDPYNRLDSIPVAVVNADAPVVVEGRTVDAGGLFVDQLRADPIFDWRFVDAAEADRGVREGDYYFEIDVPEDFSADLASGASGTPRQASMSIVLNDANGYVVGKMAQTVQSELQNRIDAAAVAAYFESVFGNLDRLRAGITQAADGANALRDGAGQARDGASALADGLGSLQAGADRLATGAHQVADGDARIADAVVPLANRVADAIPDVATSAPDAANRAKDLATRAADAASTVAGGTDSVQASLTALAAANPGLADEPAFRAAQAAAGRAATATGDVATRAGQVRDVATTVANGAAALAADAPQLQARARQAAADVQALADGAAAVATGADQLRTGLTSAADGARTLAAGTDRLATGADQLATGLSSAIGELPVLSDDQKRRDASTLASPVAVTTTNLNPAVVYGRGIAPLFFAIAMWVFGIVAFLLLEPLSARARASALPTPVVALAGFLPPLAMALVAAALLYLVVDLGMGLDPAHLGGTLGLLALGTTTFIAVAHMLRVWLGGIASAVILVLLVLQLTTCGGIYPVETLPAPFRALHPVLPMSYLVDGLRVTLSGGSGAHLARDLLVLGGFLVVTLALTVLGTARRRRWSLPELKPELAL